MMAVNGIRRVLSVDRLRFSSQFLVRTLTNSTKAKTNHSQPSNQGADHDSNTETTHFGYETVTENEKTAKVHGVFENVATKYDLMNDLMSIGIHRLWKDIYVETVNPIPGSKILDVAGGTGDIALRLARALEWRERTSRRYNRERSPKTTKEQGRFDDADAQATTAPEITVFDLSESMLEVGKQRAVQQKLDSRIQWINGNAESLPFEKNSFDVYTIAFGIRNFTHVEKALEEAFRVLKNGGRFLCLEFSEVQNTALSWVYDKYSMAIPVMGHLVASDWHSYQYLVESIRMFPNQEEFKEMIENAGFKGVTYRNLTQGICAIHSGFKFEE